MTKRQASEMESDLLQQVEECFSVETMNASQWPAAVLQALGVSPEVDLVLAKNALAKLYLQLNDLLAGKADNVVVKAGSCHGIVAREQILCACQDTTTPTVSTSDPISVLVSNSDVFLIEMPLHTQHKPTARCLIWSLVFWENDAKAQQLTLDIDDLKDIYSAAEQPSPVLPSEISHHHFSALFTAADVYHIKPVLNALLYNYVRKPIMSKEVTVTEAANRFGRHDLVLGCIQDITQMLVDASTQVEDLLKMSDEFGILFFLASLCMPPHSLPNCDGNIPVGEGCIVINQHRMQTQAPENQPQWWREHHDLLAREHQFIVLNFPRFGVHPLLQPGSCSWAIDSHTIKRLCVKNMSRQELHAFFEKAMYDEGRFPYTPRLCNLDLVMAATSQQRAERVFVNEHTSRLLEFGGFEDDHTLSGKELQIYGVYVSTTWEPVEGLQVLEQE